MAETLAQGPMLVQKLVSAETVSARNVRVGVFSLLGDGASVGGRGVAMGATVGVGSAAEVSIIMPGVGVLGDRGVSVIAGFSSSGKSLWESS